MEQNLELFTYGGNVNKKFLTKRRWIIIVVIVLVTLLVGALSLIFKLKTNDFPGNTAPNRIKFPTLSSSPPGLTNPTPLVTPTASVCLPKKGVVVASGNVKVLVVPTYFSDVSSELSNHEKRVRIYLDAFDEINAYLLHVQEFDLGKQVFFQLNFTLADPISAEGSPTLYELNPQKIRSVITEKLPKLGISNYQIVVMRALTQIPTSTSGYNFGNTIWINQPWSSDAPTPESIELIRQNDQRAMHVYRGLLTSLMFHEIMHSFGMSDNSYEKEGGRYNIFYKGRKYDGSQDLVDLGLGKDIRHVDDNTGILQYIGPGVQKEIGWVDTNNNKVIDVEEFCK